MELCNFSAGPAALPRPVMEAAQREFLAYGDTGLPIMSQSHRGPAYSDVHHRATEGVRRLLGIPREDHVLLLQGGASGQFAQVPLNFLPAGRRADYVLTGSWSEKALSEARKWQQGEAREAGSGRVGSAYVRIPEPSELSLDPEATYLHITTNNTIAGTQYHRLPCGPAPLVADMSSDFLSRPLDWTPFGLVYAGAQKNLGPAGVTVVVIKEQFLAEAREDLPNIVRYAVHAEKDSLYHTPPTFAVYMVMRVVEWVLSQGGLPAMEVRNREKQAALYDAIEGSGGFYASPVEPASRSWMNVVFRLSEPELEARFLTEAEDQGLVGLKGHRSVGGIRASLYNAVEMVEVERLVDHMNSFKKRLG